VTETRIAAGPRTGPRRGPRRDRRDRGARGPAVLPGPLTPHGVPGTRSRREVFDDIVLGVVERIDERWHDELGLIEFAVEEAPMVPDDWSSATVPLASLLPAAGARPTRLLLFRRPIELRCENRSDLTALVLAVLVEQVAELLGRAPEEIDPSYDPDPDE
jgi:predicted Zn-dependent protease with MMP-like domain